MFGQDELLWKIWLFPFNLALTVGLWSIFHRFARGVEGLLLWLAVISPTVLPSLNLIIEVPGFALSVAATALFIRASDRRSAWGTVLAGLVCALAIQTKWTAMVTPAVFVAYALIRGRLDSVDPTTRTVKFSPVSPVRPIHPAPTPNKNGSELDSGPGKRAI